MLSKRKISKSTKIQTGKKLIFKFKPNNSYVKLPMMFFLALIVVFLSFCQLEYRVETLFITHIEKLLINRGDRVYCREIPDVPIPHAMLAETSKMFIHFHGFKTNNTGEIRHETLRSYSDLGNWTKLCENRGPGILDIDETIELARKYINKTVMYNALYCNCWDYVEYWTNGQAYFDFRQDMHPSCIKSIIDI